MAEDIAEKYELLNESLKELKGLLNERKSQTLISTINKYENTFLDMIRILGEVQKYVEDIIYQS